MRDRLVGNVQVVATAGLPHGYVPPPMTLAAPGPLGTLRLQLRNGLNIECRDLTPEESKRVADQYGDAVSSALYVTDRPRP